MSRESHKEEEEDVENLDSEYPTNEQIKETLEAYRKGGGALLELIRKRREPDGADGQSNDQGEKS